MCLELYASLNNCVYVYVMAYCTTHALQEIVPYDACNGKLYIPSQALFFLSVAVHYIMLNGNVSLCFILFMGANIYIIPN